MPFEAGVINSEHVDVVAIGTVVEVLPARWDTADGILPETYHGRAEHALKEGVSLATPYIFKVREYWKNPQVTDQLMITSTGGRVGEFELDVSKVTPGDAAGREIILFLTVPRLFSDVGTVRGTMDTFIVEDGKVYGVTACVKGQLEQCGVPLNQFKSQLLEALASGRQYQIPDFDPPITPVPFQTPGGYQVPP
jgi:hypothetical protein